VTALSLALWLALGASAISAGPALAQERLPSVSEYRLPSPSASPRARPQGPVDADNPGVIAPSLPESTPSVEASATPVRSPQPRTKPSPSAGVPTLRASTLPRVSASTRPNTVTRPTSTPSESLEPQAIERRAARPAPVPTNAAAPSPATPAPLLPVPGASPAPTQWHTHSATDEAASQTSARWPWLTGLAFLFGAGAILLVQFVLRQRRSAALNDIDWEASAEPETTRELLVTNLLPARQVAEHEPAPHAAEPLIPMDKTSGFAATPQPVPVPVPVSTLDAQPSLQNAPQAELGAKQAPLNLELSARQLSATLMNTVLNYELTITNTGPDMIGPIAVGGDMIGAHASLPSRSQLEMTGNAIVPLHRLDALAPGEAVVLKGEFKLPLAAITPIRSGNTALFIPLARFRVEASRHNGLPLVIARTFVVGENPNRPGAALKPFRLDLGPRLYSQIGQRALEINA
jgi:hypothetical protein